MDPHTVAHFRARVKRYVRKQVAVLGDVAIGPDMIASLQYRARAYTDTLPYHAVRANVCRWVDRGRFRNHGSRMHTGGKAGFWEEKRQNLCEGDARVCDAYHRFPGGEIAVHNDCSGSALIGPGEIVLVFGKGEVAGF